MANSRSDDPIQVASARLAQLGYLDVSDTELSDGSASERAVRSALETLQKRYGLPVTGEFDINTIGWLTRPGCGVCDEYDLAPKILAVRKWPRNNLTFSLANGCDGVSREQAGNVIRAALDVWSFVTPLRFAEGSANADLQMMFARGQHGDPLPFDGKGNQLGHAFPPGTTPRSGDIHFDLSENWSISLDCPLDKIDLFNLALHEIGHALGLPHSEDKNSIMYPSYLWPQRYLHESDKKAIQDLYGANTDN